MKKARRVILFLIIFVVIFCISYFLLKVNGDEIWNYGFAYNISRGLVPYRDFNLIITPLYSFILSFFIILFGHHLYSMYILNSLLITIMIFLMYKKIKYNVFFILPFFLFINMIGYNLFSIFLIVIILSLVDSTFKYKDFTMGFIIGILILTKQTVGLCVFIPLFILSKNKINYLIGVLIPVFVFLIYLICNNALYNFFDYCFFGMFDFTSKNKYYDFLPIEIIIIIVMFYLYFKKYVNSSILIVIMFQIIVIPIFDVYHFFLGFIVFFYYLLLHFKINIYLKFLFFILTLLVWFCIVSKPILVNNKNSFLYGKNTPFSINIINYIGNNYINSLKKYNNTFFFSNFAYVTKLDNGYSLNKFDLINYGNMGYNGEKKYIKEINDICNNNSCYFIIDTQYVGIVNGKKKLPRTNQTNLNIIKYVLDNYKLVSSEYGFNYYSNDKE